LADRERPPHVPPLDVLRRAVERMFDDGAAFATVEAAIVAAPLTDDERDALWVHAWSLAGRDDRGPVARRLRHGRAGVRPLRGPARSTARRPLG